MQIQRGGEEGSVEMAVDEISDALSFIADIVDREASEGYQPNLDDREVSS
jgi:hypothetical protein